LREFISRRLDRIDPYRESAEYGLEQERASRLYGEIEAMLPVDGRAKLFEYSETLSTAHYLETALLVEHAFFDGMRMVQRAVMSYEF
ncbi:MAG: hypothetical protein ACM3ZC_15005, partial [Bacteroidota bacterium]